MTPEDQARADQIRARADAATDGPWRWKYPGSDSPELVGVAGDENYSYESDVLLAEHDGGCGCRRACTLTVSIATADADWIAAARSDVPWLLDRLAAATAEVERLDWVAKDIDGSLRVRLGVVQKYRQQRNEARRELAGLRARIEALHRHDGDIEHWRDCLACDEPWPCPTIAALFPAEEAPMDPMPFGEATCPDHKPIQHRDGKPPWCRKCGLTAKYEEPISRLGRGGTE